MSTGGMMAGVSCGVLVTDGARLLIGHATGSPRWDIPKGMAEEGEALEQAARRELDEETGLIAPEGVLRALGTHRYRPGKDLGLFLWLVATMPDPAALRCLSTFLRDGRQLPEFDRFACPEWEAAMAMVAPALRATLAIACPGGAVAVQDGCG